LSSKLIKRKTVNHDFLFRQKIKKSTFPFVREIENVPIDKNLKPIKIVVTSQNNRSVNSLNISIELACGSSYANVYLFLNEKKTDMYYSISNGKYSFKNIHLNQGNNLIEIFYLIESSKSPSTCLTVKV